MNTHVLLFYPSIKDPHFTLNMSLIKHKLREGHVAVGSITEEDLINTKGQERGVEKRKEENNSRGSKF